MLTFHTTLPRARVALAASAGAVCLAWGVLACSNPALPVQSATATAKSEETTGAGVRQAASPASPSAAVAASPASASLPRTASLCSAGAAEASPSAPAFSKLHAGPVLSVAVGTPPRAAIWSGKSVTLFEDEQARELPAPRLPEGAAVQVFFGRDNQPRLMGFAKGGSAKDVPVYLRFRQGVFRPEPSELGPLAAPHGALYGVLGFADPEVVCRPRELCLVKRTTGWGRVAAHAVPVPIVLRGEAVFALHAEHIERLGARGWSPLEPARTFEQPLDAWLAPNGELWVVDRSAAGLFRLKAAKWEAVAAPISEPRAIFVRSERSVFVVGSNGAAEFDGTRFHCIRGVSGPLHLALAVGNATWLAGESGLYRSAR